MLVGKLVLLRALERSDLPRLCQFNNDLEVELAGGGDPPMPQSLARLTAEFESKVSGGGREGMDFAIEADGELIGICALFNVDQLARTCEFGITIGDKEYWGQGYGRDALAVMIDYAFRYQNMHRVFLQVHGRNERAIRSYKSVGMVEEGRLRSHVWSNGTYDDLVFMGILKEEWEQIK